MFCKNCQFKKTGQIQCQGELWWTVMNNYKHLKNGKVIVLKQYNRLSDTFYRLAVCALYIEICLIKSIGVSDGTFIKHVFKIDNICGLSVVICALILQYTKVY